MLKNKVEYNQTQFLDNILKADENLMFSHTKKEMELIEFVMSEQKVTSDVIDKLDMSVIENTLKIVDGYDCDDPYSEGNKNNPLNEMLAVNNAKNICKSLKTQRITRDRDFF